MAVAAYLDKYFECVEYLPLELQRCVTELRVSEAELRGAMEEVCYLKAVLSLAVQDNNRREQVKLFRQLQQKLLLMRDMGNEKLQVTSRMCELVDHYEQQLLEKQKAVDSSSTDEFYHFRRLSTGHGKELSDTKSSSKRSSGTKRVRPVEVCEEDPSITTPRTAKKKVKTIKKKSGSGSAVVSATTAALPVCDSNKSDDSPPPAIPATPMPDLSSQPLDPNEPTYCLCQQVSFGEMIGCDNDECPIEWFHFQCVNLTSKPKGKWFCPQCAQGRRGSKLTK